MAIKELFSEKNQKFCCLTCGAQILNILKLLQEKEYLKDQLIKANGTIIEYQREAKKLAAGSRRAGAHDRGNESERGRRAVKRHKIKRTLKREKGTTKK